MEIISRDDAHKSGQRRFYTGKPCKKGHLSERQVTNGGCIACMNYKLIPAMSAPNTGLPPTPYIFPSDLTPTPEMIAYVHSRVLAHMVHKAAREYVRLLPRLKPDATRSPSATANALYHLFNEERAAARAALIAQGWTDAQIDAAQLP